MDDNSSLLHNRDNNEKITLRAITWYCGGGQTLAGVPLVRISYHSSNHIKLGLSLSVTIT
jgi:hypothetical protein